MSLLHQFETQLCHRLLELIVCSPASQTILTRQKRRDAHQSNQQARIL